MLPRPPTPTLFPYTTLFRSPSDPSVSSSDCSTFTICAMLHMYSLSAWRLKMFSPKPAAAALRMVLCCHSLPNFFRSEEHTSELQSRFDLVCRLLLEKKKNEQ